jgi:hypothetical protein
MTKYKVTPRLARPFVSVSQILPPGEAAPVSDGPETKVFGSAEEAAQYKRHAESRWSGYVCDVEEVGLAGA